jgi:hypothetical protein
MTRDKDIIYVNGDSFTEGIEVADHILPFPVSNFSLNQVRDLQYTNELIESQHNYIRNKEQFLKNNGNIAGKINALQAELRWSSKLSSILNKPVFNLSSQGGSSMYAIAFRTIADISELIQKGYKVTDAIIQITTHSRFSIFAHTSIDDEPIMSMPMFGNRVYNIVSGNLFSSDKKISNFIQTFFELESSEFNMYRWFHELYMLKHTLQSMCHGIRIIFVDSVFYKHTLWRTGADFEDMLKIKRIEYNHILNFRKEFEENLELSMLDFIAPEEQLITNGLHLKQEVHDRFAFAIAERYFNE